MGFKLIPCGLCPEVVHFTMNKDSKDHNEFKNQLNNLRDTFVFS